MLEEEGSDDEGSEGVLASWLINEGANCEGGET